MAGQTENRTRRACVGLLAHVDAGKTTLSEQILLRAGVLRKAGRVDHGDAFMDGHAIERARGITIFSEEASFELGGVHVTLMDTPGHVDFSGEMERALSVLDSAVLVVSCAEGVQSHTVTLMRMLKKCRVPVMIFLNKTDREGADIDAAMAQIRRLLTPDAVLMTQDAGALREEIAGRDEALLEKHFEETAGREDYLAGAARAFAAGELVPVLPGSALLGQGVDELVLHAVGVLVLVHQYVAEAAAVVLQHRRRGDEQLQRLYLTICCRDGLYPHCLKRVSSGLSVIEPVRTGVVSIAVELYVCVEFWEVEVPFEVSGSQKPLYVSVYVNDLIGVQKKRTSSPEVCWQSKAHAQKHFHWRRESIDDMLQGGTSLSYPMGPRREGINKSP